MKNSTELGNVEGICTIKVETSTPDACVFENFDQQSKFWKKNDSGLWEYYLRHHNAYVNRGLEILLNRAFRTTESIIQYMFINDTSTAVSGTTTTLGGQSVFKLFNSTPAAASGRTISAEATFVKADLTFPVRKIGMATTSTDAGTGLVDVIGGTGSAPYNENITLDLVNAEDVTMTPRIDTILSAI